MLVVGAQVLVGLGVQAAFQPGFDRLPAAPQHLEVVGLTLMLIAAGLLVATGAFHQIVEGGDDTPRLITFTGRVAAFALLPFGIGIGIELYIVAQAVLGESAALTLGVLGTAFAFFFWYVFDWIWRARDDALGTARKEHSMPERTSVETRIKQVLTEARVVLPGVQALLGFQLAAMPTHALERLPQPPQYVHLSSFRSLS